MSLDLPAELAAFRSHNAEETTSYGRRLAAILPRPVLVLLTGDLGAGKTMLVKGLAEGLGVANALDVTSPSYTLIHEYERGEAKLYHLDLYRVDSEPEFATLGLDDLGNLPGDVAPIIAVEWGEKFLSRPAFPVLQILLEISGEHERRLTATWVEAGQ
ncbi:MAG: tRNA (adenosine(37)-N6)-threonylcarbamoyltransferase complex ATPase subunit type 1 TsaE [Terriglobales bacterium]